ncbi:hypothetical protein MNBD_GAMMA08-2510 [hydrothermal vent metagenome]|uniref:Uncharacterized protein n=1 Tax=hydrothermal vent metagenome TaxID=652676 RepID=A0A3B0XL99_9ZZZZ
MEFTLIISIIAIIVSCFSFYNTHSYRKNFLQNSSYTSNAGKLADLAAELKDNPGILRFYDISEHELKEAGVTANEFSYLYRDFLIGSLYHLNPNAKSTGPFRENSYRYKLLESKHTRQAWPLVKKKIAETKYVERIESTISTIEKKLRTY